MNVGAVRTDLAAIGTSIGFQSYPRIPDTVSKLPALVVGVPREVDYAETFGLVCITIPLTAAFDASVLDQAQKDMDDALGTVADTSLFNAFHLATSDNWRTCQVMTAEQPLEAKNGAAKVLTVDVVLAVFAAR